MIGIQKRRRKHDKSKRRKYVKSGRYSLENAEDYIPDSWVRRWERDRRVTATATEIIEEVGPEGFTVVELARRLGMHRSTIYYSYGCKAELLEFVHKHNGTCRAAKQFAEVIDARMQTPPPPADDLPPELNYMRHLVAQIAEDLSVKDGAKTMSDLWVLARAERLRSKRRPSGISRFAFGDIPYLGRFSRTIRALVTNAVREGELPEGVTVEMLSGWVVGLVWYYLAVRGSWRDWYESMPACRSAWESLQLEYALTCLLRGAQYTEPPPKRTPPGRRQYDWAV